jgi:hypothetical protein
MAKKPPVEVSKRWAWLRLVEEENQTPPGIAKGQGYDVRTVRKAIQWARDEREKREARMIVFRQAQHDHYSDLVSFVDKLDSEINKEITVSPITKGNRLWNALRQHLPRSPLWKLVEKLESINAEIRNVHNGLQQKIAKISIDRIAPKTKEMGLNQEAVEGALVGWSAASHGEGSLKLEARHASQGYQEISYGSWNCAIVPDEKAKSVQEYISDLMAEVSAMPKAQRLRDLLAKRQEITSSIAEELATIKLKRIVPGRCKYCPL